MIALISVQYCIASGEISLEEDLVLVLSSRLTKLNVHLPSDFQPIDVMLLQTSYCYGSSTFGAGLC